LTRLRRSGGTLCREVGVELNGARGIRHRSLPRLLRGIKRLFGLHR
jgi:hypothetical protein